MADFTAKDVQALRQETGAGMMDAKKALTETGGTRKFKELPVWATPFLLMKPGRVNRLTV